MNKTIYQSSQKEDCSNNIHLVMVRNQKLKIKHEDCTPDSAIMLSLP
ncbi:predicted protein [Botrytis cinerea T4]|uniref:Uncharacterized protein n=1 Tax=Botryotinia fuckeliana (strain T4) TaxID=999810 RepID=G2YCA1_BOTF4|nr:predicted protein [Botrytis cinerea T4]